MRRKADRFGKRALTRAMGFGVAWILYGLSVAAPVAAQELRAGASGLSAPETPRDLSRYKEEPVPGGALLVAAYGAIWLLVAGFVGRLAMRQSKLEGELRTLQDRLDGPLPPEGRP